MTDEQLAELAKRIGLERTCADYPDLVRAAMERGLAPAPLLDAARTPMSEPAHYFVVRSSTP